MNAFYSTSLALVLAFWNFSAQSTVLYVDLNNSNPEPPYTNWSTASQTIQDAVDNATNGDFIWVADGKYQTGGRVIYGSMTNRLAITKAITVQSVNGPNATSILGDAAIRCVYLTNGATLTGFTLVGGSTLTSGDYDQIGGGAWCASNAVVENCVITNNSAWYQGGGVYGGTLKNCVITGNSSRNSGGGVAQSLLYDCALIHNSVPNGAGGGGAVYSFLTNCFVAANTNTYYGAGLFFCAAVDCIISNNFAITSGGGADACFLTNCIVANNTAAEMGGGTYFCTNYDSIITGNRITGDSHVGYGAGGAGYRGVFVNCIISGNMGRYSSGTYISQLENCTLAGHTNGIASIACFAKNCVIYYNSSNWQDGVYTNCCSIPLARGQNNITNAPGFIDLDMADFHLTTNSPCINSGKNGLSTVSKDFDGNPRIVGGTVDIGAFEFQSPTSILSYAWAQQYSLPTDGSADFADSDGDGFNNQQEWIAGTIPTNAASLLELNLPSGKIISWQSVAGKTYFLERSTNLAAQPAFSIVKSNIVSQGSMSLYYDNSTTNSGPYFYRVGVQDF